MSHAAAVRLVSVGADWGRLLVAAIILFGEPIRWETNLQLLLDVLLTDGSPAAAYHLQSPLQLPVLACNMDLVWMAEAPSPR